MPESYVTILWGRREDRNKERKDGDGEFSGRFVTGLQPGPASRWCVV